MYKRIYRLIYPTVPEELVPTLIKDAYTLKRTIGFSWDDGGAYNSGGNVVEVLGAPEEDYALVEEWFRDKYPHVEVEFIDPPFVVHNPLARAIYITSRFNDPRSYGPHEGIDFAGLLNGNPVEVRAGQLGHVSHIGYAPEGYGNYVVLTHNWFGHKYKTWYCHLSEVHKGLAVGQQVAVGYPLGTSGSTGNSTGVHLHLSVQWVGHGLGGYFLPDVIDPLPLLRE